MANLLGLIVAWVTFPGVILHEWSHKFFCDRADVPVYEVCYFRLGNPVGYVKHGEITRYKDLFLITMAPFLINSVLALMMFILPSLKIEANITMFFNWLGISFAMHAFPSDGDAMHIWERSKNAWRQNPIALLGFPLVIVIVIANLLRIFWFDLIYAGLLYGITYDFVRHLIH